MASHKIVLGTHQIHTHGLGTPGLRKLSSMRVNKLVGYLSRELCHPLFYTWSS